MKRRLIWIVAGVAVAALILASVNMYRAENRHRDARKEKFKEIVRSLKEFEGVISYVYDGDTVLIKSHGVKISVRLWGVDAPEKKQPGGVEARKALIKMTSRRKIKVKPIESGTYGRLIAKLYVKNKCINLEMIRGGYCWWYEHFSKNWTDGKNAQAEAQATKLGIWGAETPPVKPYIWRKKNK